MTEEENDQLVLDRLSFIDESVDEVEAVTSIQDEVFKKLSMMLVKELDLDEEGNILKTRKNQKAAQKFTKIRSIILSKEYRSQIGKFLSSFDKVKKMSDQQIAAL